jgi:biopolymer transport protein ExbB/TolQ
MNQFEKMLYDIAGMFLPPVLMILVLMFLFAIFSLGRFGWEYLTRSITKTPHQPLTQFRKSRPDADQQLIELYLLKQIEPLRIVSRVAPMLGLVATMIPMGPALINVAAGNFVEVANNLGVAFAAVIIALLSASITFWILTIRRRWLLEELKVLIDDRYHHKDL